MILSRKERYLQVSLNSTLSDARYIISTLPVSDRIILEAGTPLIKRYGMEAISTLRDYCKNPNPYIVADMKTMDRAETEVNMCADAGASAVICLGEAPVETINSFIATCAKRGIDSMVDMMNIEYPFKTLRLLKKQPDVVLLHRGVDEQTFSPSKPIPYIQINKVLSGYSVMISIAGGDTIREVERAVFNGAHIVVVWRDFYSSAGNTGQLATDFLSQIR